VFVFGRIDEILSREKTKEQEKEIRFVELGELSHEGAEHHQGQASTNVPCPKTVPLFS